MPWWGWLIVAGLSLVALYYVVVLVFAGKVAKRVFKAHDSVQAKLDGDDPFDDPFFKQPFVHGPRW
jgi:hypothetical protein